MREWSSCLSPPATEMLGTMVPITPDIQDKGVNAQWRSELKTYSNHINYLADKLSQSTLCCNMIHYIPLLLQSICSTPPFTQANTIWNGIHIRYTAKKRRQSQATSTWWTVRRQSPELLQHVDNVHSSIHPHLHIILPSSQVHASPHLVHKPFYPDPVPRHSCVSADPGISCPAVTCFL